MRVGSGYTDRTSPRSKEQVFVGIDVACANGQSSRTLQSSSFLFNNADEHGSRKLLSSSPLFNNTEARPIEEQVFVRIFL